MEISDNLLTLFTAQIKEQDGDYVVEVPDQEFSLGNLELGETYRTAIVTPVEPGQETPEPEVSQPSPQRNRQRESPPVSEGDQREVEIEDVGEQGDGIARIGPGYIVFVPNTHVGDQVNIEITDVRDSFAFGEVVEGPY